MLELNHLSKSYGKKEVLHDLSFVFEKGIYGILGPNGAGKTTLFHSILGLVSVKKGMIHMDIPTERIGFLPQKTGVFRDLTVLDQMYYFANMKNMDKKQNNEISEILQQVNLLDMKDVKGKKLSGGMIRRVGLAQAMLNNPELMILDEPTAGLDPEERLRIKQCIRKLNTTILVSTHIVEDLEAICDYLIILDHGYIRASGKLNEISNWAVDKVYEVPREYLITEDFILRETEKQGGQYYRILTNRDVDADYRVSPTVEDGYLCILKHI